MEEVYVKGRQTREQRCLNCSWFKFIPKLKDSITENKWKNKSYSDFNTDVTDAVTIKTSSKAIIKGKTGIKKRERKMGPRGIVSGTVQNGILIFFFPRSRDFKFRGRKMAADYYRQLVVD